MSRLIVTSEQKLINTTEMIHTVIISPPRTYCVNNERLNFNYAKDGFFEGKQATTLKPNKLTVYTILITK